MAFNGKSIFAALVWGLASAASVIGTPASAETPIGETVTNIASFSFETSEQNMSLETNPATFTVVARPTPSTIDFFRVAPAAPEAVPIRLNGSDYLVGGDFDSLPRPASVSGLARPGSDAGVQSVDASRFEAINAPETLGGTPIDVSAPVRLVETEVYLTGELIIARITDEGQNGQPDQIETIVGTLSSDAGDSITLRFYESGPNTGQFFAYVPSAAANTDTTDAILGAPQNTVLTARYVDQFDATEVSIDTAVVNPFGRVFDALTGELVDGARVTLVDEATGQPAQLFGIDGVSPYPATVETGSIVTDASGLSYPLGTGEYLFPLIPPGNYRFEVEPPATYRFPSIQQAADFVDLPTAPFEIAGGSFGERFSVDRSGVIILDVPLDGAQELTVFKRAGEDTAAIGDFLSYSIVAENTNEGSLPLILRDTLPRGVRYMEGSAQLDGQPIDDPEIASNGRTLLFPATRIDPGANRTLTYVTAIGAGAPEEGDIINRVQAVGPRGQPLSNTAEAAVTLEEDLFRSRFTLVGRVAEQACQSDEDWPREIEQGIGVPGVRLYLETGEFVITDVDGLYHFQGVEEGTHVVRIDPVTLPDGYEAMVCEENTRFAGSATSQFVDVQGGGIWRANFYLRKAETAATANAEARRAETDTEIETASTARRSLSQKTGTWRDYDIVWLNDQDETIEWAYPDTAETPSVPTVNVGIKAPAGTRIKMSVNGRRVNPGNVSRSLTSTDRSKVLLRWRGLDIVRGENLFEAEVTHADGRTETLTETIWYVTEADRARLVDDQSILVADGRTYPVVAVRLEDAAGRPLRKGTIVDIDVPPPYRLATENALDGLRPVDRPGQLSNVVTVGDNGIAHIELAPTLETGRIRLNVPLSNERVQEIDAYLLPERRDWIVVGLADGGLELADGALEHPGRIALFAKGMIRGDWLLTIAVDTAKRRGIRDDEVFNRINPNAFYTLYGDQTFQGDDAESQFPVFVRLERDTAQFLFGDFNTDLSDSELLRYNRRVSGLKAGYVTDRVTATGFVTESNQQFQRDELGADGTTGPYQLSGSPIVRTSEIITVETRDRFRPDIVLAVKTLERDRDYEIDYANGEVRLRAPLAPTDSTFNPNVIVAEYEAQGGGERKISAGGRAALRDRTGAFEVGASVIHDEAGTQANDAPVTLAGVDATALLTETTEIRAEIAGSHRESGRNGEAGGTASAFLVEGTEIRERVALRGFLRQEDENFGVGQTLSSTATIRRYGAQGDLIIDERVNPDTREALVRSITAEGVREEALDTGERRDVGAVALQQTSRTLSAAIGVRAAREALSTGDRESLLATADTQKVFPTLGLTVGASHEAPLSTGGSSRDEVAQFPERTILSADQVLFKGVSLNVRHEIQNGANSSGSSTLAGISASPWRGARVTAGVDEITQESGRRLASNVAVDQTVQINSSWSASFGVADRSRIDGGDDGFDPIADEAESPFEGAANNSFSGDENFRSAYFGAGFLSSALAGSGRIEIRDTAVETRHAIGIGAARELSEVLSFAGAARIENRDNGTGFESTNADVRLGLSYRPRGEGLIVFDRFDVAVSETQATGQTIRLVNNLALNRRFGPRGQGSLNWGIKHTTTELNQKSFEGWTHLLGGEYRHDLTKRVDVGLAASVLRTNATGTTEFAIGPSVGFSPKDNVWASVGYNVAGFRDDDFQGAEYTRDGLFFKFRLKFDETTVSGLLDRISPRGDLAQTAR
ncbi:MAG: carboxypeptidase-like regulatory domain-containing protein [Pseudomonadota bacterium]